MKKRTREIKIRLTDEELADLNAKAGQTVFSREEFCRRAITGKEVKQAPSPDIPILIRDIRRAGSNVNQLLKLAESTHLIDAPQMRKALVQTYLAADAILNAYVMDD
jgi:hypothetical protein